MDAIEKQRMDIFSKTKEFTRAREAQAMGLYPFFIPFEDSEGTIVRYEGREIIMIGSNNYLGLTNDPRVIEASKKAIDDFGSSVTGSRSMNGSLAMHRELRSEEHTSELQSRENLV